MTNMHSELKKMQRVLSVVTRAADRCFQAPVFKLIASEFYENHFTIDISFIVFDEEEVSASASNINCADAVEEFIVKADTSVSDIIKRLSWDETRTKTGISKHKPDFTPENEVQLTSTIMFKQLIVSLA